MNLVLLVPEDFITDTRVRLSGRRFESIARIRGDELHVGVVNGRLGTGRTVTRSADSVEIEIVLDRDPPPPLPLTLVLALPRPKVLNRVIAAVTSMGVKRMFLIVETAVAAILGRLF